MFQCLKKVKVKNTGAVITVEVWEVQGVKRYLIHNNWHNPNFEDVR